MTKEKGNVQNSPYFLIGYLNGLGMTLEHRYPGDDRVPEIRKTSAKLAKVLRKLKVYEF